MYVAVSDVYTCRQEDTLVKEGRNITEGQSKAKSFPDISDS